MTATDALRALRMKAEFPLTENAIHEAYRNRAKRVHPDKGGSEVQMKEVNEAHDWLIANRVAVNRSNEPKPPPSSQTQHATTLESLTKSFVDAYPHFSQNEKQAFTFAYLKRAMGLAQVDPDYLQWYFKQKVNGFNPRC